MVKKDPALKARKKSPLQSTIHSPPVIDQYPHRLLSPLTLRVPSLSAEISVYLRLSCLSLASLREFFCSPFFAFFALFRGYFPSCLRAFV
jgi:hypothetical protein